ncbi:MAG: hypothetical protein ACJ748_11165 [Flavisolibacter sp.]
MKKLLAIIAFSSLLASCNNGSEVKSKMDSLGKKFDSSAEKIYDSTKAVGKELKDRIKNKIENKDSAH